MLIIPGGPSFLVSAVRLTVHLIVLRNERRIKKCGYQIELSQFI